MTRTMLFGDDDTMHADVAWLWINSHQWPQWDLEVITAVPPVALVASEEPPPTEPWTPTHPRVPFQESELREVTHLRCERDPRMALLRPTDLLVIGPRGRRSERPLHLGSTSEWLLSRPPSPLVLARRGLRTASAIICHDGSMHARAATEAFCALPWAHGVAVEVISVDEGHVDTAAALADAASVLDAAGIAHTTRVLRGDPTEVLTDAVREGPCDLVVVGTRGLSLAQRLRIGSTARTLAHATHASMLLACAAEDDEPT